MHHFLFNHFGQHLLLNETELKTLDKNFIRTIAEKEPYYAFANTVMLLKVPR